jgi:group I intron endonuclease
MSYLCNMSKLLNYVYDLSLLDNLTKLGIYKIIHVNKSDLFYIGSASGTFNGKKCQKGFYRRFLEHLRALENKKHDSKYLQNVVNKYGIEGIRFEILEIVDTDNRKIILEREQHYLDLLNPVYNSSKTARCPTVPYTPERKKAASVRMKGKKLSENVYNNIKVPIYQFDKQGRFLKKYESIQEASDITFIDRASISNSASGKRKSAGGYLWSFTNSILITHKPLIYQYSLDDCLINTFTTLEEVKKELCINTSTAIKNCFTGKQKKAYGFKWLKV